MNNITYINNKFVKHSKAKISVEDRGFLFADSIYELIGIFNKEIAKELSVRYIVQGTLWKTDSIFQLSIELYDTIDEKIVWSERWKKNWDELPLIKDNLQNGILNTLNIKPELRNLSFLDGKDVITGDIKIETPEILFKKIT